MRYKRGGIRGAGAPLKSDEGEVLADLRENTHNAIGVARRRGGAHGRRAADERAPLERTPAAPLPPLAGEAEPAGRGAMAGVMGGRRGSPPISDPTGRSAARGGT